MRLESSKVLVAGPCPQLGAGKAVGFGKDFGKGTWLWKRSMPKGLGKDK